MGCGSLRCAIRQFWVASAVDGSLVLFEHPRICCPVFCKVLASIIVRKVLIIVDEFLTCFSCRLSPIIFLFLCAFACSIA